MYGPYKTPFKITEDDITLSIERVHNTLLYKRKFADEKAEKVLLTEDCRILINPIEPLNTPKKLTPHLLIELENHFAIEPKGNCQIYIKFPVEIGVFIGTDSYDEKEFEIMDIFSTARKKFTLYGGIRSGILCKYYKSDIYPYLPSLNPLKEGLIELNVVNKTDNWIDVTKVVFNAYQMKLYYNKNSVSMKATMAILGEEIAEIEFIDSPLEEGMTKSLELYVSKKLLIISTKFVMEWGL